VSFGKVVNRGLETMAPRFEGLPCPSSTWTGCDHVNRSCLAGVGQTRWKNRVWRSVRGQQHRFTRPIRTLLSGATKPACPRGWNGRHRRLKIITGRKAVPSSNPPRTHSCNKGGKLRATWPAMRLWRLCLRFAQTCTCADDLGKVVGYGLGSAECSSDRTR